MDIFGSSPSAAFFAYRMAAAPLCTCKRYPEAQRKGGKKKALKENRPRSRCAVLLAERVSARSGNRIPHEFGKPGIRGLAARATAGTVYRFSDLTGKDGAGRGAGRYS